ncbi:hypothetical protein [Acanthamoeba castellanii mamavirus]|uniref:Uncharacterized protein n=1 Tax=Acanthamoeba polyphaga mimivirus TaxID=212035 RepID=E3VYA7_MIMIV|nr:hypothetical protein MIMI_gp0926 [Acanthamoeba polyphaga mimivirus]ADO18906.1 hypothetical protein [Acanthamoeba polyphaga mimivirus]AEQ61080.1 hypothetical protein [Acanthamoeba castellanii mamavirus]AKI79650.1 hypothetical protein [Acanthamoeba polyphaga mimivirus]
MSITTNYWIDKNCNWFSEVFVKLCIKNSDIIINYSTKSKSNDNSHYMTLCLD